MFNYLFYFKIKNKDHNINGNSSKLENLYGKNYTNKCNITLVTPMLQLNILQTNPFYVEAVLQLLHLQLYF